MRKPFIAVATGLALALVGAGCTAPQTTPTSTSAQPPATDTPSPAPTTFDPPSQFDLIHAVRLKPVDSATQGIMDGFDFFTLDQDTVQGVDVRDGSSVLSAPLGGTDWTCSQQVVDDTFVYTIAANYQGDPATPVPVQVTAVDRATGAVAWTYRPPTTVLPVAGACDQWLSYVITATKHGLLLSLGESSDTGSPDTIDQSVYSTMLDSSTGAVLWQADGLAVSATGQADFGVAVALAPIPTPLGVFYYQASPINLATGDIGPVFWATQNPMQLAQRYQLAGQTGDSLILVAHADVAPGGPDAGNSTPAGTSPSPTPTGGADSTASTGETDGTGGTDGTDGTDGTGGAGGTATQITANTTTVYQVSATTGQISATPLTTAAAANLANCQLATPDRLVCTTTDDPTMAVGISLTDGSTVWRHAYTTDPGPDSPLLFHGYLYGFDEPNNVSYVVDASNGNALQSGNYPRAIAVDETGLVFAVTAAGSDTAWQCWWAPALA